MRSQILSPITWSLIIVTMIAAYLRFYGLGFWSLSVDEYYLAKSTISVSENGLPNFPDGGYYMRGLLQQYLTAPIYLLTNHIEFSVRLIPALANLLTIPAVYLIARSLANKKTGLLAVVLFALSLWEIEFARFGRMYAPFQAIFLWQAYFLIRYHIDNKLKDLITLSILSFFSIFVYEGAIFSLMTAFFALTLHAVNWQRIVAVSPSIFGLGLAVILKALNLRNTDNTVQPDAPAGTSFPLNIPELLYKANTFSIFHWFLVLIGIILTIIVLFRERDEIQESRNPILYTFLISVLVISAFLNQLFMTAILAAAIILIPKENHKKINIVADLNQSSIKIFFIWISIWLVIAASISSITTASFLESITSFPELKERIYWPLESAIPRTSAFLLIASIGLSLYCFFKKEKPSTQILLIFSVLMLIAISSINTLYSVSRYSFFLYPIFLIILAVSIDTLISALKNKHAAILLGSATIILFLAISEDYKLDHLLNITSAKYNYRMPYSMDRQQHYYIRFDYESPADFVDKNKERSDKIVTTVKVVDHYLRKVDFTYVPYEMRRGLLGCGGDCYIWNKTRLLSDKDKIQQLIEKANDDLWLISYLPRNIHRNSVDEFIETNFPKNVVFVNYDGSIAVYKF